MIVAKCMSKEMRGAVHATEVNWVFLVSLGKNSVLRKPPRSLGNPLVLRVRPRTNTKKPASAVGFFTLGSLLLQEE